MIITGLWQQRFNSWLTRRIPPAQQVTLNQKSIFIVPSKVGYSFLIIAFLIFLIAINYQNSPAYAVSFFMVGLFLVTMIHTWRNLAGLTITSKERKPVYAGQDATFKLSVETTPHRIAYHICLEWPGKNQTIVEPATGSTTAEVYFPTTTRGWLRPGRLRISTRFPLGLFHAWSWVDLKLQTIVYPEPDKGFEDIPFSTSIGEEHISEKLGGDGDFAGQKEATVTNSLAQINWKAFSRTGELLIKQFYDDHNKGGWLDYRSVPGKSVEEKLSRLCALALLCHNNNAEYGLWLPGQIIETDSGDAHLHHCLKALALFSTPYLEAE